MDGQFQVRVHIATDLLGGNSELLSSIKVENIINQLNKIMEVAKTRNKWTLTRQDYIGSLPLDAEAIEAEEALVYIYTSKQNRPSLMAFSGKRNKPNMNFAYRTVEERNTAVAKYIEAVGDRVKRDKEYRLSKLTPTSLTVGDILYTSWGYDQTNVEFYQVLKVIGKRTVEIRQIGGTKSDYQSHGMACEVSPIKDSFIENAPILKKRVTNDSININQSATAWKWGDKKSTYCSWYA